MLNVSVHFKEYGSILDDYIAKFGASLLADTVSSTVLQNKRYLEISTICYTSMSQR